MSLIIKEVIESKLKSISKVNSAKVFRDIGVIIMIICCTYQLIDLTIAYLQFETVIEVRPQYEMTFPAVTQMVIIKIQYLHIRIEKNRQNC